jgi:hypothetical protein
MSRSWITPRCKLIGLYLKLFISQNFVESQIEKVPINVARNDRVIGVVKTMKSGALF